jgi:hypothetical protein
MTDREINRANIASFIARAINRASVTAIDAEFGLRIHTAEVTAAGRVRVNLADSEQIVIIDFEHFVPREISSFPKEKPANARS